MCVPCRCAASGVNRAHTHTPVPAQHYIEILNGESGSTVLMTACGSSPPHSGERTSHGEEVVVRLHYTLASNTSGFEMGFERTVDCTCAVMSTGAARHLGRELTAPSLPLLSHRQLRLSTVRLANGASGLRARRHAVRERRRGSEQCWCRLPTAASCARTCWTTRLATWVSASTVRVVGCVCCVVAGSSTDW